RKLRDRRGISLEEISRVTRVASSYLEALESDRQSALPAPVFTCGFIRAYCQALGESPDEALARYDGREGGVPAPPRPATSLSMPVAATDGEARSRSAVLVSFVLLVILGMALFAVALMTQPAREDRVERRAPEPAPPETAASAPASRPTPDPASITPPGPAASPGPATSGTTSAPVTAGVTVRAEAS